MIKFEKKTLENGLKLIVNEDKSTPLVAVNIMYNVGSRDENPEMTGFAHLFEHFMFGGSVNVPRYDEPLERAGGQNNAFTNNDITNYYSTLPVENFKTSLWLESDRMMDLLFTPKNLEVQKSVVVEEFKQNYLNQPYGDVWLLLRPLAYKVHPYQWHTIGKVPEHIQNARMEDVVEFYKRFYNPANAVMTISGNIKADKVFNEVDEWFGDIKNKGENNRNLPAEPKQESARFLKVERKVPLDGLFKVFHMSSRTSTDYYTTDLLSDVLSNGDSSRLYQQLVKKQKLFSNLNAFITGDIDAGLFVFSGYINQGVNIEHAEEALKNELEKIVDKTPGNEEVEKVKNKVEAALLYSEMSILNKAINLSYYEIIDDVKLANEITGYYREINGGDIRNQAERIFNENNSSTLYYIAKK